MTNSGGGPSKLTLRDNDVFSDTGECKFDEEDRSCRVFDTDRARWSANSGILSPAITLRQKKRAGMGLTNSMLRWDVSELFHAVRR